MKNLIACAIGVGLALVAVPAEAGTLVTPSLGVGGVADRVNCRLLNTHGKAAEDVTIDVLNQFGGVEASNSFGSIASGTTQSTTDSIPPSIVYCRAEGMRVSKGKTWLTLCALDAGATVLECVTAP